MADRLVDAALRDPSKHYHPPFTLSTGAYDRRRANISSVGFAVRAGGWVTPGLHRRRPAPGRRHRLGGRWPDLSLDRPGRAHQRCHVAPGAAPHRPLPDRRRCPSDARKWRDSVAPRRLPCPEAGVAGWGRAALLCPPCHGPPFGERPGSRADSLPGVRIEATSTERWTAPAPRVGSARFVCGFDASGARAAPVARGHEQMERAGHAARLVHMPKNVSSLRVRLAA